MSDLSGPDAPEPPAGSDDGLAVPIDHDARRGLGVDLGVSLGGGGVWFVAWQTAYLHELADRGVHLEGAELVVGTSAGSLVAAAMTGGNLSRLHTELRVLSKVPALVGAIAPAGSLRPSQLRAVEMFRTAQEASAGTVRSIGHAALAACTPPDALMARNVGLVLGSRRWPAAQLQLTCVDAYTGQRCVLTHRSRVRITRAVAASSAVPGLFTPQPVGDRRCMDGGVSGTGIHLDLLAGARRAVVVCLTDGAGVETGAMTVAPGSILEEVDRLRGSGTEVFLRTPEAVDMERLMDPVAVPEAIEMGRRQAAEDAAALADFIGQG